MLCIIVAWLSCQREDIGSGRYLARSIWWCKGKISTILCCIPRVVGASPLMFLSAILILVCIWTICYSFHCESSNKHGLSISLPIFCCTNTLDYHNVACLICISKWITLFQRAGAVFPPRSERSTPVFTPPQTQPLSSYPQNLRNIEYPQGEAESPTESEFPTLRYANGFFFKGIYQDTISCL